ncbi:MAG: bacteriocin biosynthesis cyclodehydratase domain-containing protein [Candidatus Electronema aureum]|uniref:Bacteriocin biosynthesis cyclodehydratase domain-containing protein n=1 Tax=Candidatus Electronema aureum TaxID=2005002 RepID=A0A521G3M3_9BACT|nr:MAG: bacteriocin biosynthesis cyclodehydratase domain-containing protein [Candidatus Electronema aureum]
MQQNVLKLCRCRQIPVQEHKLLLKSADTSLSLAAEGIQRLADCLLPLLDGSRTEAQVLAAVPTDLQEGAKELLQLFAKEGFLSTEPAKRLADCRIVLIGGGRLAQKIAQSLRESGAAQLEELSGSEPDSWSLLERLRSADMAVVCTDLPRPDICELVNKAALTRKLPWLLVQMDGRDGWVGPLFIPRETGCYTCLRQRLLSCSFHAETDKAVHAAALRTPFTETLELLPPFADLLAALAALEVIRHLTELSPPLTYQAQLLLDCITGISRRDVLHRIPRCPACSETAEQVSAIQPFSG